VDYQIYYRLFSLAGMLFTLALTPMWSAITKAFEEKDSAWINKYFKLLNQLVLIVFFCEFLIIPLLQIIVNIWLGQNTIDINYFYAIIFALFGGIFVYHSVLSTFACGIGRMRLQAIFYTIGIVVKVIFVYSGTNLYNDWIIIVISDIVILAPYCLAQHIALKKQFTVL
jgi:O-antigen/teichoic acid export membrane protein